MHKRIPVLALILLLAAALALPACVGALKQPPVERHYYHLAVERGAQEAGPLSELTLRLRTLRVSPGFAGSELVYRMGPSDFVSDFYNLYFVSPPDMLTQELRAWLHQANLFANVVEDYSLTRPGLTLEGVVNALYGDFAVDPPLAVVRMQFFLVDENTRDNEIVFSASYDRSAPIASASAQALVQGLTQGVRETFTALEADLRASMPAQAE